MSFDLLEVHRLKAQGGPTWHLYEQLLAEADAAMHDSPAHRVLGEFQKQWEANPNGMADWVHSLVAARIKAVEAARG
jgi:hypothetical protein